MQAPSSALSAVVTLSGAQAGTADITLTVNRDPGALGAASDTKTFPNALKSGLYPVTVQFFSQPSGGGVLVGQASRIADLSGTSVDLGDFAVSGTVADVLVSGKQTVAAGSQADLIYTPVDASGAALANITPGSAFVSVVGGQNALAVSNGRLVGLAPGLAQVTVSIDGKTSVPQSVGAGQADISLGAGGTRGPVTLSNKITRADNGSASTYYGEGSKNASAPFISGWFDRNDATAPAGFGDQAFDHWELNGQVVSQQQTLTFTPSDNNGAFASGGVLTAVYKPRTMPAGGFAPQFNQADNVRWNAAKFPLRVYLADPSLQSRIAAGFDWWVKATGGVLSYAFVADPSQADISVSVGMVPNASVGEAAQASVTYDVDTSEITTASIVFTADAPKLSDPRGDVLTALSAHEFGHVLGIISEKNQGHSPDTLDTMYFKPGLFVGAVTERDVNSLENLYPTLFNGSRGGGGTGRGVSISRKNSGKTTTRKVF